jgi:hypothetical protein
MLSQGIPPQKISRKVRDFQAQAILFLKEELCSSLLPIAGLPCRALPCIASGFAPMKAKMRR